MQGFARRTVICISGCKHTNSSGWQNLFIWCNWVGRGFLMIFYLLLLWKVMGTTVTAAQAEWFWAACLDKDLLRSGFLCSRLSLPLFITCLHYPQLTEPVHIWFPKFSQKIMWFHLSPLLSGVYRLHPVQEQFRFCGNDAQIFPAPWTILSFANVFFLKPNLFQVRSFTGLY